MYFPYPFYQACNEIKKKSAFKKLLYKHDIFLKKNEKYDIIILQTFYMDVDYRKLWKLLIDKGIKNRTDLIKMAGISTNILAKLGKGEFISMDSMQKICRALDCDVGDICVINEKSSVDNE